MNQPITLREAQSIVREYQRRLSLHDWDIRVVVTTRDKVAHVYEEKPGRGVSAFVWSEADMRQATIFYLLDGGWCPDGERVASPAHVIGHEMAHLAYTLGEERLCNIVADLLTEPRQCGH